MNEIKKPRSLFFPILLVCVGIFLLLTNLGMVQGSAWNIISTYWPLIFVIGGLDGLYRRDGWVGPLTSIGLGMILTLGNLHYLPWGGLGLLLRLWPVLLVAWGLDIAFNQQRSLWSTLARITIGLLLVGGILWLSMSSPLGAQEKVDTISQSLDGATRSAITFEIGTAEFSLSGQADKDILASGTAELSNNASLTPQYTAPQDGVSSFALEGTSVVVVPVGSEIHSWDFEINPNIPIDLITKLGAGNMELDLSATRVGKIQTEMGVGRTDITFPKDTNITGKIENAVGETVLRFPKGADVVINFDSGLVSTQLPAGFTWSEGKVTSDSSGDYQIELDLEQAIGSLLIQQYE